MQTNVLLAIVFVPAIGSFLLPIAGRISEKLRNCLALLLVLTPLIGSAFIMPMIAAGEKITIMHGLPLGFDFILTADQLAVFMALVSSLISAIIILYSFGYIGHYKNRNEYYFMVVLFVGAMMGIIYSGNLIYLYLFWEITAITSWRLIGFFREKEHVMKADKAFLVTFFGAICMLIGFIYIHQLTGSFDMVVIKNSLKGNPIPDIIVMLILFGILSKSATLPFHTWLPDAGVAPSPVTALLHAALLVKIGVYVFARLFVVTFSFSVMWHTIIPVIAAISALVAAGAALVENDMKRIIAYSTVSQIAFILLGLSVGGEIGIAGALLFILMHGLAKGGLFLCAGIVEQNAKTKDITKMGGLIATMPITAISFLACAFSVMGVPPFGGFFSKYLVFSGAVSSGHTWIAMTFLFGSLLTIIYLFRIFNAIFLGEGVIKVREGSKTMVFSVALLAILSILGGIYINYPSQFVQGAVKQMLGL
ncbi:MAG: NADH-quinone oxidoreductase subunit L [Candidatus Omnitrophota bacterium]|jgi:NADH:ubiquinone oxidoreductase subunit 5 (subunit L)/multisubunit Na+/H+ antiporter MnhA subunit